MTDAAQEASADAPRETPDPEGRARPGETPRRARFYAALDRLPLPQSFIAKIMLVCFLGIHVPLIALVIYFLVREQSFDGGTLAVVAVALVATLAGTIATFIALYCLLSPLRLTTRSLRDHLRSGCGVALPLSYRDEVGQLMRDVQDTVTQLEAAVTAAQGTRDAAVAANSSKAELVARMTHEFKTPLGAVISFSEMLQAETFGAIGNPKYREFAGEIRSAGNHLMDLIEDTLVITRGEIGRQETRDEPLDVDSRIEEACNMVSGLAHRAGVNLSARPDAPVDARLSGDRRAVNQMLLNLLSNAIKFTPRNGRVEIASRLDDGAFRIHVRDTGVGIEADEIERILQPYQQSERGQILANERQHGSGLGLAVVDVMMRAHGGAIEIDSAPDAGTTVTLAFPAERTISA